ncbi:hypothetical protein SAMN05519103_01764 [Rhizobiales bacterium GAS113]|nr:hypothetical protein SAMN05519103_01764 [Rhizobiales bacterium GAS113]
MTKQARPEPKVCPECDHVFQGNGWDGIDAHWKAKHSDVMPYEEAWPLIKSGTYKRTGQRAERPRVAAATVEVLGIERHLNNQVVVKIVARSALGRFQFPVMFEDQGSRLQNERRAISEVRTLVEEIAVALRLRLES